MKESFCAKQLSLCATTLALIKWAELNSGLPCQYDTRLLSVPKVLHQTNRTDHEKLQSVNNAACLVDFQRMFYDDVMCEKYISGRLGPRALVHYKCLVIPAHSDVFFRYVLLLFEGGTYLDIKSCFLLPISRILHACIACSLLTCIAAGDSHIHQGILICPVGHPLLHRPILNVMETPPPHFPVDALQAIWPFVFRCGICLGNKLLLSLSPVWIDFAIGWLLGCWERRRPAGRL